MTTKDWNNLPKWLPKQISKIGLTPEKAANRTGVSRTMMYAYLNDTARPGEQTALKLSRVLGVKFEELLAQYTPKKNGRPRGSESTAEVRTRKR